MAPPVKQKSIARRKPKNDFAANAQEFYRRYVNFEFIKSLIFDPARIPIVSVGILLAELIINLVVIQYVKYTEIDWIAYMQEVEGFLNGTTNYAELRGDTGPLVYPAGFVYIYTIFYYITSRGQNVRLAQYIFVVIYLLQMYFVLKLYAKTRKVPPYALVLSAFTSYRIHSIFVLRLFNDPIAILFVYAAINMFLEGKWTLGSVLFSIGVSIKMNCLLFAPAILVLYLTNLGIVKAMFQLFLCGVIQLVLGAPFLMTYPIEYLKGSFDLGRIFEHKWTVNYRFLPRNIFENKSFHLGLLVLHVALLLLCLKPFIRYMKSYFNLRELEKQLQPQIDAKNAEMLKQKSHKQHQKAKKVEEELTEEQQDFLNSFEKSLKKSNPGAFNTNKTPVEEPESEYSIHFNKVTQLVVLPLFLANFIGVMCARSLHYQFYIWYFHSLPYLVWFTNFNISTKFLILGIIEYSWNTYPSTNMSSFLLHLSHVFLFAEIIRTLYKTQRSESNDTLKKSA